MLNVMAIIGRILIGRRKEDREKNSGRSRESGRRE